MKISETKDSALIAKLNKPVHDLHYSLYPKYFNEYKYEEINEVFKKLIENEKNIFLLLEENEDAVGYAWIEIRDYPENAFKKRYQSIYVHQISIAPTQRKKGYGTALMNFIDQRAIEREIDLIELDYWIDNKAAEEFYEKHKFVKYREFVYKQL
ncbi:ribosomal protein S18 acetylase RimI-like enzyme [Metabacillus crassostreae]|uniref:GNAT family N-acetyltransferase n=1 Tax=Metabacillus crassostreae TaxID=929098 RepID=UPI00195E5593|nr:GNAT family N-acetyltransferase [Metabacillus crassostreae]MBM7602657.1 ribosomal protein S18 acetylase RimI-like enzyme [Metabacillus crassostreae]